MSSVPAPAPVSVYGLCGIATRPTTEDGIALVKKALSSKMSRNGFSDEEVVLLMRAFGFDPDTVSIAVSGHIFKVIPKGQKSGLVLELDVASGGDSWASIPWG